MNGVHLTSIDIKEQPQSTSNLALSLPEQRATARYRNQILVRDIIRRILGRRVLQLYSMTMFISLTDEINYLTDPIRGPMVG